MNATATNLPGRASKAKVDIAAAKTAICSVLRTPKIVAERLGMLDGAKPDGEALHVRCNGPGHKTKVDKTLVDTDPSLKLDVSHDTGRTTGHCFVCGWHGSSPIDVVGAVRLGHWHELKGQDFIASLEAAARIAGIDLQKFTTGKGRPRKPLTDEIRDEMATIRQRLLPLSSVPADRVEPWWHTEAASYLRGRGIDPAKVDTLRYFGTTGPEALVAGCLGGDVTAVRNKPLVVVSRKEGAWDLTGHRLVLPLFAAGGMIAGLVGRSTNGSDPKSLGATGADPRGAVMANPLGRSCLASRDLLTERWTAARATRPHLSEYPRVIICEGEMDFLSVATHAEAEGAIVLGVKSESWDVTIAGCIPTGSDVYILTHSDEPGCRYRDKIAASLTGRRIFVRHAGPPSEKLPDENDRLLADPAGYSPTAGCVPYEPPAEEPAKQGKQQSIPVPDQLLALATEAGPELIVDDKTGDPHLVVEDGSVVTAICARGEDAEVWLRGIWDDINPCRALRKADVSTVLDTLAARAQRKGRRTTVFRRVGRAGIDRVYLDLCDGTGEAVEATGYGWRVAPRPDCGVVFARPRAQLPLPRPRKVLPEERAGVWERFFGIVRVPVERRPQVVGWLLATMLPRGPYPIVVFGGEQGSAKSTSSTTMCSVVDPSVIRKRKQPRDDEDVTVAAKHCHILDYDNLSTVSPWLSDLLCQVSTGGADGKRKLFTDSDQAVTTFERPVVLTGIPDLATRGDLIDRSIVIHLDPIPPSERKTEKALRDEWAEIHPMVLGILLDGIVAYLKTGPAKLKTSPRLADFYALAEAAIEACGYPRGSVVGAYEATQGDREVASLEGDPTFLALDAILDRNLVTGPASSIDSDPSSPMMMGRMGDLLAQLKARAGGDVKLLPQTGGGLESWFRRHASALRSSNIHRAKTATRSESGQVWKVWRGGPTPPASPEVLI